MENKKTPQKVGRLFVTEFESTKDWTNGKRSILSNIKEDDLYLIFKSGKGVYPSPTYQQIIEDMGEYKIILDGEPLDDNDYIQYIKQEIEKYSDSNTYIYFLSMDEIYLKLKTELTEFADVQSSKTFSVGRKRTKSKLKPSPQKKPQEKDNSDLYDAIHTITVTPDINIPQYEEAETQPYNSNDTQTSFEAKPKQMDEIPKPIVEDKKEEIKNSSFAFTPKNENTTMHQEEKPKTNPNLNLDKSYEDKGVNLDKNYENQGLNLGKNYESQGVNTHKDIKTPYDDAIRNNQTQSRVTPPPRQNNLGNNTPPRTSQTSPPPTRPLGGSGVQGSPPPNRNPQGARPTPGGNVGGRGLGGRGKPTTPSPESDMSIQELERIIFGGKQEKVSFEKVYTELDDSKAQTVNLYMERLIENINKFAKKVVDYNFDHAQYVSLVTTLVKSTDYMDFMDSWEVVDPGRPLGIDEKTYASLLREARYYAKVCETLYENDEWAYQ